MSDGQHYPHVHIMFLERLIDDVEKDGSEPPFEECRKHGAPKNRNWADKSFQDAVQISTTNTNNFTDSQEFIAQKFQVNIDNDFGVGVLTAKTNCV